LFVANHFGCQNNRCVYALAITKKSLFLQHQSLLDYRFSNESPRLKVVARQDKKVIAFPPHKWGAGRALSRFTYDLSIILKKPPRKT